MKEGSRVPLLNGDRLVFLRRPKEAFAAHGMMQTVDPLFPVVMKSHTFEVENG